MRTVSFGTVSITLALCAGARPLSGLAPGTRNDARTEQAPLLPHDTIRSGIIRGFELNTPPPLDAGQTDLFRQCRHRLVDHSFGQYSGHPEVAPWSPTLVKDCGGPSAWRGVVLEVAGTSAGRQYDRLGSIWLDGVELWRMDNPEPTIAGVVWNASKDVSKYYPLFERSSSILFDFPNYLSDTDNAALNLTLDIVVHVPRHTHYQSPIPLAERTAELIVPLSHNYSRDNSMFTVGGDGNPASGNTSIALPRNTRSALVEIYASGNGQEEEWYTSVPDELWHNLSSNTTQQLELYPRGPVREIQVGVDGQLAGFAQPMAVIFTGGIAATSLWRPMVAHGAFDQPTYTLDLTPFVPILADGKQHTVSLSVVSAEANGTIDSNWYLSGNIQVNLDSSGKPTTGQIVKYEADPLPYSSLTTTSKVLDKSSISATIQSHRPRTLKIETLLHTGSGPNPQRIQWEQSAITFATCTVLGDEHLAQINVVNSRGHAHSSHGGKPFLDYWYNIPLNVTGNGYGTPFLAWVHRGYHTHTSQPTKEFGLPSWSRVDNDQYAHGGFRLDPSSGRIASSAGNATQSYSYADANDNSFDRQTAVWSANSTTGLVHDHVRGSLAVYAGSVLPP